jgi:hypothetical protein
MKSSPQSTHFRLLSWNSIDRHLVLVDHADALLRLAPNLLAASLPGKRLLSPAFVTRFQIEGMLLDVLDDVFLLHLTLEASERTLDGLAFLDLYFSHALKHPLTRNRYSL